MTIRYSLDTQDYIRFYHDHYKYSPEAKRSLKEGRIWIGFLCLLCLFFGWLYDSSFFFYAAMVIAVAYYFLLLPICISFAKARVKKLRKDARNRALFGDVAITITPDGVHLTGDDSDSTLKWNLIQDIIVSPSQSYFYISTINAVVIPNRAFNTETEREQFIETARQYRALAAGLAL